ncbi:transposase [Methylobacter tundripaludum]|uniref:transposase n=1 Tax=Methylobacter tundripaludum TaxID=173365 RepID=UPI0011AFF677|nr:transposase [Methylobacter tundripaludum]
MITINEGTFSVTLMSRILKVSRSVTYDWKRHSLSKRNQANKALSENIKRIFDDGKARAGSPRITRRLQDEGVSADHN